jgi:hypothetical protein
MAPRKIPDRLDVLLAPKARKAVVLRRGPAKQVCTVGWDLSSDTFQLGQWIKGRIHGYCCDLSPAGKFSLYYLMNPSEDFYCWTTISRAPYLKAIGRWRVAGGMTGGGLFLSDTRFYLNNAYDEASKCGELENDPSEAEDEFCRDWRKVYFRRLLRDGWKLVKKVGYEPGRGALTFEKPLCENRVLVNIVDASGLTGLGRGICSSEYRLIDFQTGEVQFQPNWEWVDVVGHRLLWAEGGKIFSANIEAQGLGSAKMLYDFNDMTFQAIEAPY